MSNFKLIPGVYIPDISKIKKEYRAVRSKLMLSLSSEDYAEFFKSAVKLLSKPVFFFIEIPSDNDESRLYYLDNLNQETAEAVLKRYGGILYSDGVIKFGFGSHQRGDEVYMQEYQTVTVYTEDTAEFKSLLERLGYRENRFAVLTWDILSEENVGECVNVEYDDEGYPEMVNNLIDAGMYAADQSE